MGALELIALASMSFVRFASLMKRGNGRRFAVSTVRIGAPTASDEITALADRLCAVLEEAAVEVAVCDVGGLEHPDAATVEALARLQLAARRLGCRVLLVDGSVQLHELLALAGLCDVVGCEA